jgi:hypothetical protein
MPRTSNKTKVNTINVMRNPATAPAPAPAPALAQSPTLFDSMKQGFGFGIGSSIARNLFEHKPTAPATSGLSDPTKEFKQCMERTFNNYEACELYLPSSSSSN